MSNPENALPRGFWALMFTQFQGAFSDNFLKWLVVFLVLSSGLDEKAQEGFIGQANTVFAVPFLLFSVFGGWLADRFSKRRVMIGVKLAEVGIMLLAAYALSTGQRPLQLVCICLMGVHSTFFAPAKYGILPEVLPERQLSFGNGVLEMLTFVAIILGTMLGGWLADHQTQHGGATSGIVLAGLAVAGLITAWRVPQVAAADAQKRLAWNVVTEIWRQTRKLAQDRQLWWANWGNTLFFGISVLLQMNLTLFTKQEFGLTASQQVWFQGSLCLGIGLGSFVAGKLSHGHIRYGFIPVGGLIMGLACVGMNLPLVKLHAGLHGLLALAGLGAGFFIVPIAALLQHRPAKEDKGQVSGMASWWSWVGIVLAAALLEGFNSLNFSRQEIFLACGVLMLLGSAWAWRLVRRIA
jgi:MFS family permease